MASLHNELSTVSRCTAVDDELDAIDYAFWSVVNSLPPDSPFLRRLTAMFQDADAKKQSGPDSAHESGQDDDNQSGQGDRRHSDRVLRSSQASPAASKASAAATDDAPRRMTKPSMTDKPPIHV